MIDELQVDDVALIHRAKLYPAPGLTVITGETGAGKTALLGALKLLSGERGDASLVREGAASLQVQGRFFSIRSDLGDCDPGEGTVASRSITADGRSRVHIDGAISQVGALAKQVGSSIDLCGQHEHQSLFKASRHRELLDAWMGDSLEKGLSSYRQSYALALDAEKAVSDLQEAGKLSQGALDQARYVLRCIDEVHPLEGEYEELREAVPKVENADMLLRNVEAARDALSGDDGVLDKLGLAVQMLEQLEGIDDEMASAASGLREASYAIEDAALDIGRCRANADFNPGNLEDMQNRMAQLQGLMRTWGPTMDEVFEARSQAARSIAAVEDYDAQMQAALARRQHAEEDLARAARFLHDRRCEAAPAFAAEVSRQMDRLELQGASLECRVAQTPRSSWTSSGSDKVEFLFRPGPGLTARPLAKIASGGEVSRVMLAIKVVLGKSDRVETLVFDEVDAGVGGSAACALADVLLDLSCSHQVIVVTHLAQIAVLGQVHYIAVKRGGPQPETEFIRVEGEDRVAEIARMLSGDGSEVSLEHARQMLARASGKV